MENQDWLNMLDCHQELHRLSRELLTQSQKQILTASERELLAHLYLQPQGSTPLELSKASGMKKEAVSRCLRNLFDQEFIEKRRHPQDERSYILSLTEAGQQELNRSYRAILRPLYELRRHMGADFDTLFGLVAQANEQLDKIECERQGGREQ